MSKDSSPMAAEISKALCEYLELFDALVFMYKYALAPTATFKWFGERTVVGQLDIHFALLDKFQNMKHVDFGEPKLLSYPAIEEEEEEEDMEPEHSSTEFVLSKSTPLAITPRERDENCSENYTPLRQLEVEGILSPCSADMHECILRLSYRRHLIDGKIQFTAIAYESKAVDKSTLLFEPMANNEREAVQNAALYRRNIRI